MNVVRITGLLVVLCVAAAFSRQEYALTVNGSNQAVSVPYSAVLTPAGTVTIELWLNAASWGGGPSIISNTEFGGYAIDVASGNLQVELKRNGNYGVAAYATAGLSAGWHHVAATYDGRYLKLYTDGILRATNDAGGTYPIQYSSYNNSLIFGAEAYQAQTPYGYYFNGSLDEIRIWSVARTQAELQNTMHQQLAGNESGLVGYWRLDEGSGSVAHDLTANGNDGTLLNNPTWIPAVVALPVELRAFTVEAAGASVRLAWKTASETRNARFEIERRAAGPDAAWRMIGSVAGAGTSAQPRNYSFTDDAPSVGRSAYRLKQIDSDGTGHYSDAVETEIAAPAEAALLQNYPNPFNPSTVIRFRLSERSDVHLGMYDLLGREVAVLLDGSITPGDHDVRFDGSGLAGGTYVCRLVTGTTSLLRTIVLVK